MEDKKKIEQMVDIKEIFYVLIKNIWLIIFLAIVGYVGAYIYAKTTEIPTYTTSVSLYVKSTTNKTTMDSISAGDLSAAKTIATTYIAVLEDDVVMETIGDKLLEKYSIDELKKYLPVRTETEGDKTVYKVDENAIRNSINIEQVNDTELLKISVTTINPAVSADICTFITEYAPEQLIRVVGAGSVENVGRIKVPKNSDGSKVPSTARNGMVVGIIIALVIVYFKYILDNTVNDGEVLRSRYDLPMLAEIPFYDVEGTGKTKPKSVNIFTRLKNFINRDKDSKIERSVRNTIKDVEVPFIVTESYNTLRTNLMFALSTNDNKSNIAIVSSSLSGEGKSTSAANLSIAIGETEARVLLIDADLRRPTQHKLFKIKNEKGLSTLLSSMSNLDETVNKNVCGNLDVITSGPMPPNPSQMLTSENMDRLLDEVKVMYDYVIIDSSPINIVSDALILAKKTAGIVLVARHGITTFDQIEKAIESINFAGASILGSVVNSVNFDNGGIYSKKGYKYYKYKYKYNYNYEYTSDKNGEDSKSDNK